MPFINVFRERHHAQPQLGIRANLAQFVLLIVINAFVGGMVGLERTVLPLIGTTLFRLPSDTITVSFIVSFGIVKAFVNLFAGTLADRFGRKRILILGWLFGLPVPFLLMWSKSWYGVNVANMLLGVNQGLAWSMTVNMKIDLVGPRRRGLAIGLNEFAGYFMVGLTAFATGYLASLYGLRPKPFYLGIGYVLCGLLLSWFFVRETQQHVAVEAAQYSLPQTSETRFRDVFSLTSWKNRSLFAICQAGLVNNLNDGMSWGIFPLFFSAYGLSVERIGILKFVYPAIWGIAQIGTGPLSDRIGRKGLIVSGLILQALAIALILLAHRFTGWLFGSALLGLGTAMVYPTLIAAVSDNAAPQWRARALSVYRFWRDMGYAIGALLAGILADAMGYSWAIGTVAALTFFSGLVVWGGMQEKRSVVGKRPSTNAL
ncbi:Major Facilitator Superfamily transporter [Chthonomonas calidirosea]|uniref:Major Facilitator Superfamily n=1 Tax=Chthonomonas calidirosea (strain DSM 23976 / ICMP 18418 / T49) TaxID=1303518 RepID=S0EYJ5_CHTCT|nr:MFS transporter [Chthonomonas calidirosea]CCW35443.1 Major Facilitator Superfamily [Chthonomonas calidirosea T49]CEK20262.1 Major Facilitator Superfamily transporter [Chthonomonas calidirosea]